MEIDPLAKPKLADLGYYCARRLDDGRWIAVSPMVFTTGLFVITPDLLSWTTRFCYERSVDAIAAVEAWDGQGDPPGPWVKQKPEERLNPALFGPVS